MKVKVVATGEEVTLNWIGFDLVWIIHDSGEQELVHPRVIGREPRKRPKCITGHSIRKRIQTVTYL